MQVYFLNQQVPHHDPRELGPVHQAWSFLCFRRVGVVGDGHTPPGMVLFVKKSGTMCCNKIQPMESSPPNS